MALAAFAACLRLVFQRELDYDSDPDEEPAAACVAKPTTCASCGTSSRLTRLRESGRLCCGCARFELYCGDCDDREVERAKIV
jgi:hypothetical protein